MTRLNPVLIKTMIIVKDQDVRAEQAAIPDRDGVLRAQHRAVVEIHVAADGQGSVRIDDGGKPAVIHDPISDRHAAVSLAAETCAVAEHLYAGFDCIREFHPSLLVSLN